MEAGAARPAMAASYRALSAATALMAEEHLAGWSRCRGWTRADDVLFHTLLDARHALVTFATPAAAKPDVCSMCAIGGAFLVIAKPVHRANSRAQVVVPRPPGLWS